MARVHFAFVLALLLPSAGVPDASEQRVVSVCELAKNFSAFRSKAVKVRGVLYYDLIQQCPAKCAEPKLVSIWLMGAPGAESPFDEWAKIQYFVGADARKSEKRFEIWGTVEGRLEAKHSSRSPCDTKTRDDGYGHLNACPAQILVERITDIEVKENPESPYDYASMHLRL